MAEEEEQGADVDVSELGPHIRQDHARVEPLDDDVPLMRRGGPLRSRGPAVLAKADDGEPHNGVPHDGGAHDGEPHDGKSHVCARTRRGTRDSISLPENKVGIRCSFPVCPTLV